VPLNKRIFWLDREMQIQIPTELLIIGLVISAINNIGNASVGKEKSTQYISSMDNETKKNLLRFFGKLTKTRATECPYSRVTKKDGDIPNGEVANAIWIFDVELYVKNCVFDGKDMEFITTYFPGLKNPKLKDLLLVLKENQDARSSFLDRIIPDSIRNRKMDSPVIVKAVAELIGRDNNKSADGLLGDATLNNAVATVISTPTPPPQQTAPSVATPASTVDVGEIMRIKDDLAAANRARLDQKKLEQAQRYAAEKVISDQLNADYEDAKKRWEGFITKYKNDNIKYCNVNDCEYHVQDDQIDGGSDYFLAKIVKYDDENILYFQQTISLGKQPTTNSCTRDSSDKPVPIFPFCKINDMGMLDKPKYIIQPGLIRIVTGEEYINVQAFMTPSNAILNKQLIIDQITMVMTELEAILPLLQPVVGGGRKGKSIVIVKQKMHVFVHKKLRRLYNDKKGFFYKFENDKNYIPIPKAKAKAKPRRS